MIVKKTKKFFFFGKESFKLVDPKTSTTTNIKLPRNRKLIMEFTGGGIRGVLSVFQLYLLESKFSPEVIKNQLVTLWGCSTGAIIAGLYNLGLIDENNNDWNPAKIFKWYVEKGDRMLKEKAFGGGFTSGAYDNSFLKKTLQKEFGNLTMKELYDATGVELNIRITNATDQKTEVWNYINHPDDQVWIVILMSTSAPVFFDPIVYKGKTYVDGGCGSFNCNLKPAYDKLRDDGKKVNKYVILSFGTGMKKYNKIGTNKISQIKWYLEYNSNESENRQVEKLTKYSKEYGIKFNRWNIKIPDNISNMAETDNIDELLKLVVKDLKVI